MAKLDPGLRNVLIAGCSLVGAAIIKHNVDRFKKVVADNEKNEPWASLMYKIGRAVLVCPNKRCGHIVIIQTFEAQMADNWECQKCGCVWTETSHCDVIIKEGK